MTISILNGISYSFMDMHQYLPKDLRHYQVERVQNIQHQGMQN